MDFNFDDELYPSNITILIGKNGTGKSQALKALFERIVGADFKTDGPMWCHINKRPAFSKIIVVSYSPFEELYEVNTMHEIAQSSFKYCGFKDSEGTINLDKVNIETCEALINLSKQDQNNFLKDWINKLNKSIEILNTAVKFDSYYFLVEKEKSKKNYLERFETIEIKDSIYLKVPQDIEGITDLELYISKEYIKLKEVKLFYKNEEVKLSAGQKIFLYLVINIISAIKKESLILIDEPETHLHPNMEITFMFLLKEILEYFNSYAIIATHSMIITREIPSKFVRIFIKNDRDVPVINKPVMETFGADISAICNEVFDNALVKKPYKEWLLDTFKDLTFDQIYDQYGDKLNSESLIFLRNKKAK